jgi:alkylation response protein AidB-like acyl-CoA dehydrogenase
MARKVESTHAWIESVIFQSTQFSPEEMTSRAGGAIALLKAHATDTFEFCASEAAQIFGGNSYTRSGQGEKIERLNRDVKAYSIPGGSTELMLVGSKFPILADLCNASGSQT